MGPMRIPKLTLRFLEPLGVFSKLQSVDSVLDSVPVLIRLELRNVFRTVFFISNDSTASSKKVSYSSPQRGHIGSSFIFKLISAWFSETFGNID